MKPPLFAAIALMALTTQLAHGTDYIFETLNFPGAQVTVPQDINNDGVVVGLYLNESDEFPETFGFVLEDGEYSAPDFGISDSILTGISESGIVLGAGVDFQTFSTPIFTMPLSVGIDALETFTLPEALLFALPGGVNDNGQFVGTFFGDDDTFGSFVRSGDEIMELTIPDFSVINAADINEAGQIAGSALNTSGESVGFILQGDDLTIFNHPDGETELFAINNVGGIAGAVTNQDSSRTFIFDGENFEDFAFPGAGETLIFGLNDHGMVVGQYFVDDAEIGFIATPVPEPENAVIILFASIIIVRRRCSPYGA